MTCQMNDVVPGPHGQGIEIPCTNIATWEFDGLACCDECRANIIKDSYFNEGDFSPIGTENLRRPLNHGG